ncbi:transposase [Catalinimonas alkaloidigena]|nr:ISL3 family transposase [Catalinimonas alkaloidigena]MDF9801403.1 transposase [Catalinimonas alkaloidigena]
MSILAWEEGLVLDEANIGANNLEVKVKTAINSGICPLCQTPSSHIHSHYCRKIADLPLSLKETTIILNVKRFRCMNERCSRKIFCERLGSIPVYSRRTRRMEHRLKEIGYQLGGQAGAYLASLLGMPVSDTTLIRILKATETMSFITPKVLGVDDWSLKKGQTYGTILVDLEKQQPIELLPDREAEILATWLKTHPGVEIISRDRASCYSEGAKEGAPDAIQIADRWHLLKNLGDALKRMMEKQHAELRMAAKALATKQQQQKIEDIMPDAVTGPAVSLLSPTAQRAVVFQEVKSLLAQGYSSRVIARQLKIGRNTVNRYRNFEHYPAKSRPKSQQSTVLPFREYLAKRWQDGERNIKQLWREIKKQGYQGSLGSVYRFFENIPKDADAVPLPELEVKNWTPRKVQFLLSKKEQDINMEEQNFLNLFFEICPQAKKARGMALSFHTIFEKKDAKALPDWILQAKDSGIAALKNFATGLESDYAAVEAAATYHWSNGQVEGQVNRLKLIKRQMYGRAGFELLRKRVVNHYASG